MPVVSPVAASVTEKNGVTVNKLVAGEAIAAGDFLYQLSTDNKAYKADNTSVAKASVIGVAIAPAASGDQVYYVGAPGSKITLGVSLTKNQHYIISSTAGAIELLSDATTGDQVTYVGYGDDDGDLYYSPQKTGQTVA